MLITNSIFYIIFIKLFKIYFSSIAPKSLDEEKLKNILYSQCDEYEELIEKNPDIDVN